MLFLHFIIQLVPNCNGKESFYILDHSKNLNREIRGTIIHKQNRRISPLYKHQNFRKSPMEKENIGQ